MVSSFPVMDGNTRLLGLVCGGGDCSSTLLVLAGFATIALPLSLFSLCSAPINQSTTAIIFGCLFIPWEQVIKERLWRQYERESVRFFEREGFANFSLFLLIDGWVTLSFLFFPR